MKIEMLRIQLKKHLCKSVPSVPWQFCKYSVEGTDLKMRCLIPLLNFQVNEILGTLHNLSPLLVCVCVRVCTMCMPAEIRRWGQILWLWSCGWL